MTSQEIKDLIRRNLEEVWAKGNFEVHEELSHGHRVTHEPHRGELRGHETHKQAATHHHSAFSNLHIKIEQLIVEGDMAAARFSVSGKHSGEFMGIPPTGKEMKTTVNNIYRFEGDKIAEVWSEWDQVGLMRQLGLLPASTP